MTEQGMRELDEWIAENVFGWRQVESVVLNGVPQDAGPYWWPPDYGDPLNPKSGATVHIRPLPYSWDAYTFRLIKYEIVQRGWRWVVAASFDNPPRYAFHVIDKRQRGLALEEAKTEELAGCLAFKAAVEAEVSNEPI